MEYDIPDLLRRMMTAINGGQVELARRLSIKGEKKVAQSDVSRWLSGSEPKGRNFQRIIALARELGVTTDVRSEDVAASLESGRTQPRTVPIKGYVGASSEAFYYRLADEDFEPVAAPEGAQRDTVALEIRGKSAGIFFEGWLVFYNDVRSPVTEDLIGKPCVVGLADDRVLLKIIQRDGHGGYQLRSNRDDPPIENVEIEWAARVINMRPR